MEINLCYPVILVILFLLSCISPDKKSERLARKYCASCHAFPEPYLLDKKTWEKGVLPQMAFRMGLDYSQLQSIDKGEHEEVIKTIPSQQMVSEEDWNTIRKYYLDNSPDSLTIQPEKKLFTITQFNASTITLPIAGNTLLTLIKFDSLVKKLFIGTRNGKLYRLESTLQIEDSFNLDGPPSDIIFQRNSQPIILSMGNMDRNDQAVGKIIHFNGENDLIILEDSLKRPVHIQKADLNDDGEDDFIVSAFGNFSGALLVFERSGPKYIKHVIHSFPGTRKTIVKDFNKDGLPDILALIAQGDEQFALFTNRGNFKFSIQVLLKFPAVYGSSYFDVLDFNKDGNLDILYTNGDNADYSPVLKSFHGIRIFLNDGKNLFQESFFYPMYGATQATACDFDQDGDLDIAAISFFPDFKNHPEHGFVYLENKNDGFSPFVTPLAADSRWITMETADIDGDADVDILLGSLTFPNGVPENLFNQWKAKKASLLLLRNTLN